MMAGNCGNSHEWHTAVAALVARHRVSFAPEVRFAHAADATVDSVRRTIAAVCLSGGESNEFTDSLEIYLSTGNDGD